MSSRERLTAILLGGFITVGVVGLFAYLLVLSPLADKNEAIDRLQKEVDDKTAKKEKVEIGNRRLAALKTISLPPEPNTAQREYNYVLTQLLNKAGIPAGNRTVVVKLPPDKTTVPLINPGAATKDKKYAYQRVTADITMSRVRLDTLMKFLTSYHQLSLMQHISKLTVKVQDSDPGGSGGGRGGRGGRGGGGDRSDLTVTLTTEAIILDGLEPRDSLVRIPRPVAAVGGQAVYFALDTNPQVGRDLVFNAKPKTLPSESNARDYSLVTYKDPFHGSVPPPVVTPPPLPPVEIILPSVAEFITVSAWTAHPQAGTAVVDIYDKANNITYEIKLTRKGEKLNTSITKQRIQQGHPVAFEIVPGTDVKSWENKPFTISDALGNFPATSSTKRTFTVHGLVPYGLILSSTGEDEKVVVPQGGGRGGRGGGRGGIGGGGFLPGAGGGRGGLPTPTAAEAVAGTAVTRKAEQYYVWTVGQSLDLLKPVPNDKVDALLKTALAPLMPDAATTTPVASTAGDGR